MTDKEKVVNFYNKVNEMMCHIGAEGEIDTRNVLVDEVMGALYEIDNGEYHDCAMKELLNKIENAPDERQQPFSFGGTYE